MEDRRPRPIAVVDDAHPDYPTKLGETTVVAVDQLCSRTANEIEEAASQLMNVAIAVEAELKGLADEVREKGAAAHEHVLNFANMASSVIETMRGLSTTVKQTNGTSRAAERKG